MTLCGYAARCAESLWLSVVSRTLHFGGYASRCEARGVASRRKNAVPERHSLSAQQGGAAANREDN